MPTGPDGPVAAVREEARLWMAVAQAWEPSRHQRLWADLPATEAAVVRFYDPGDDLDRRARWWGHGFASTDLASLCRFGAALATAEGDAWEDGDHPTATRALADRRFFLGDRILHWAVPYLDSAARCYGFERGPGDSARLALLELGERLRPAPALTLSSEGLTPPGEDAYGPLRSPVETAELLLSVWSGRVVMRSTLESMGGVALERRMLPAEWLADGEFADVLRMLYQISADRWRAMVVEWPGSARLWHDLAARADRTALLFDPGA